MTGVTYESPCTRNNCSPATQKASWPYTLLGVMSDGDRGQVNEGVDANDVSMTSQHSSEDLFAEEYNSTNRNVNVTRYSLLTEKFFL